MNAPLALRSLALVFCLTISTLACEAPCAPDTAVVVEAYAPDPGPSWVFRRGTYTHDPYSGARVAQYMRTPPVEPLDDQRMVTSRYRRSRTNVRGIDGSVDTYYEVQAWGNGRGGIDAEWERFHDAWKESYLQGGYYNQGPWLGGGHSGFGGGHPGFGFGGGFQGGGFQGGGFQGGGFGTPGWVYGEPWYAFPHDDRRLPHKLPHGHSGHHGGKKHDYNHRGDNGKWHDD